MSEIQMDGSDDSGPRYFTESGFRAEVARETREQVAREIEACICTDYHSPEHFGILDACRANTRVLKLAAIVARGQR
jgi:predicted double-glycine peptidase